MKLVRFFWPYFRRYTPWAVIALTAVLMFAATTGGMITLIEPIFDEVLQAGDETPETLQQLIPDEEEEPGRFSQFNIMHHLRAAYLGLKERFEIDDQKVVYFVPLLFVVVYAVRSLFSFISGYSFQHIGLGITTDIRNDLYRRLLDQSSRFHSEHTSGELVSRVVNDVTMMQVAVSNRLLDLFQQSVTLVVMLIVLLSIDFKLAVLCLVVTPLILVPIVRFGKGIRGTSHRSQERMADLAQLLSEGIRGHRVVKAFGMEGFEFRRFAEATRRHLRVNLWAQVLSNLSSPVIETMAALGGAGLLIYAGRAIRAETLSVGTLVTFLTTLLLMYDPIRRLNKVNLMLQEALAAAHRVSGLMAVPNEVEDAPDGPRLSTVEQSVRFEGVTFAYDHQTVLRGVDMTLKRGEIVALVGSSGAGKSTLVNLVPRFFDPNEGRVTIDGIDIRSMPLESLRGLIGIVTQETMLFNDTVRANIAYGRSDLPLEKVRAAARAAFADEFVLAMPEGYDSVIGEAGVRLSGGQRQRLAIARALLKDAPILILDEATSQLDSESEALVQKALYNLMEGRTVLVIAHRLATVVKADRIAVMAEGRIVEEGNHEQLIAREGIYKRLYDLQFRV